MLLMALAVASKTYVNLYGLQYLVALTCREESGIVQFKKYWPKSYLELQYL